MLFVEEFDRLIDLTIEKNAYEMYVILLNYKAQKLGFSDTTSKFNL